MAEKRGRRKAWAGAHAKVLQPVPKPRCARTGCGLRWSFRTDGKDIPKKTENRLLATAKPYCLPDPIAFHRGSIERNLKAMSLNIETAPA